jgi:hypothetical protein
MLLRWCAIVFVCFLIVSCETKKTAAMITGSDAHSFSDAEINQFTNLKLNGLENILGTVHDVVGKAALPWQEGGSVDLYYFPNGIPGTGIATMELIKPDGTGLVPGIDSTYELLAFTKLNITNDTVSTLPFNQMIMRTRTAFTLIANYAQSNVLQPGETTEIPEDGGVTRYFFFDSYKPNGKEFMIGDGKFGLLLIIELHRQELDFAINHGSSALLERLKAAGHYPYSDLDRKPVAQFDE